MRALGAARGDVTAGVQGLRMIGMAAAMLATMLVVAMFDRAYLSVGNLQNVLVQSSYLMVFASAQMLVLIVRGLDLSIGNTVSVVSVCTALVAGGLGRDHSPGAVTVAALCIGLGSAAVIGIFNGLGVSLLRVNAFVVTLASLNICLGISSMLSDGKPVAGLPVPLSKLFYNQSMLGLPVAVWWAAGILTSLHLVLSRTVLGRSWYAIGSNASAALLGGISVRRCTTLAFVACSVIAGLGAVLLTARTGSGEPNLGGDIALQSIAAAAVGGVGLRGGRGGVLNVVFGALLITFIANAMNFLQVNGYLQQFCMGILIVVAAAADARKRKF